MLSVTLMMFGDVAGTVAPAEAQSNASTIDPRKEYNVKGAYLYSFGRYVNWSAETWRTEEQPFVIGVFGESRILEVLAQIARTKKINGRAIQVRQLVSLKEMPNCQIVFVSIQLEEDAQRTIIAHEPSAAVLLVGESPGFAEAGGVMNFRIAGGAVQFEINVEAARQRGITVDAKLLRIAKLVSRPANNTANVAGSPWTRE